MVDDFEIDGTCVGCKGLQTNPHTGLSMSIDSPKLRKNQMRNEAPNNSNPFSEINLDMQINDHNSKAKVD